MKVFIVPAAYNERDNIGEFIRILEEEVFPKIKNHSMHILIADDNSPDGTGEVVKELMKKYKNLGLNQGEKKGLGAAYVRAMGYAIDKEGADVVMSIDSDLQHDPHAIPNFLEKIDEGYDIVVGTRYSQGGSMPAKWPLQRKIFSVAANILMRSITGRFGLHDWTGGYRAIRKEVFQKEKEKVREYTGYTFQVAFLYKSILDKFKIAEVPIHFHVRRVGDSKIAPLQYIINVLTYVTLERIQEKKRFIKFLIVGGSGFILQLVFQEVVARIFLDNLVTQEALRDGLSAGLGAEAAIILNFTLNNLWTFGDTKHLKQSSHFIVKLLKFNLTSVAAIVIQSVSVFIFVHLFGDNIIFAGIDIKTRILVLFPTIILLVIPLNYIIYNKIIWKTHHLKK